MRQNLKQKSVRGETLQKLAVELGGRLEAPRLRWKYDWIRRAFGWVPAKSAQLALPEVKTFCMVSWDRLMYNLESSGRSGRSGVPRFRNIGQPVDH